MVTAMEYRELAIKYYKWAAEAKTEEVRDTYLRLAYEWTLAALGLGSDGNALLSPATSSHRT
jgi:hypothetical protein